MQRTEHQNVRTRPGSSVYWWPGCTETLPVPGLAVKYSWWALLPVADTRKQEIISQICQTNIIIV